MSDSILHSTSYQPDDDLVKVDLDVAGTANSMMAVSLEMEDKRAPWFDDDWGEVRINYCYHAECFADQQTQFNRQQKIVRKILPEESLLEYPPK